MIYIPLFRGMKNIKTCGLFSSVNGEKSPSHIRGLWCHMWNPWLSQNISSNHHQKTPRNHQQFGVSENGVSFQHGSFAIFIGKPSNLRWFHLNFQTTPNHKASYNILQITKHQSKNTMEKESKALSKKS